MEQVHSSASRPTLKALLEAYERQIIEEALLAAGRNQRRAARALGVLPTTLHEKMKRLGLLHRTPRTCDPQGETESPALFA
jgi:two-component system response regulator HydG